MTTKFENVYKVIPWSNVFKNMAFAIIDTEDPSTPLEYGYPADAKALEQKALKLNERLRLAYNMGMGKGLHDSIEKIQSSEDTYTFKVKPEMLSMLDEMGEFTENYMRKLGISSTLDALVERLGFKGPSFDEFTQDKNIVRSATLRAVVEWTYKTWKEAGMVK